MAAVLVIEFSYLRFSCAFYPGGVIAREMLIVRLSCSPKCQIFAWAHRMSAKHLQNGMCVDGLRFRKRPSDGA